MMRRNLVAALVTTIAATAILSADTKFSSTWKSPEATGVTFAGKKVVALVVTDDESVRVSGEESLAEALSARGIQGVAAYRLIPREEVKDVEKAKGWLERAAVQGAVVLRPVTVDRQKVYTPAIWVTSSYADFWNYYGYTWASAYGGSVHTEVNVVVETLIYSLSMNKLLWAGVSESRQPKELTSAVKELVTEAVKEMKKQGLVQK